MMQKTLRILFFIPCFFFLFTSQSHAQLPLDLAGTHLMQPGELVNIISGNTDSIKIFSVGPFTTIPHSIHIGMADDKDNIVKFKEQLKQLDTNSRIVIYCGCCPFEKCPNVRPALNVLKEMGFTNYYLLNLPHNIKIDWMEKGYPQENQ